MKASIIRSVFVALILGMILFFAVVLSSCSSVPTPMHDARGKNVSAYLVAGKGALNYNADGSMSYVYNNEKSWQHTMQTASSLGVGYFNHLTQAAKEITAQLANKELNVTQREQLVVQLESIKAQLAAGGNSEAMKTGLFMKEATPYTQQ